MKDRTKELMPLYKSLLEMSWSDPHMVDYCMKKASVLVQLDNGMLFEIEKKSIEKDFCFGYSDSAYDTEDYDRANSMAYHARTSEDYFVEKNMASFRDILSTLDGNNERIYYSPFFYLQRAYYDVPNDYKLVSFNYVPLTTFLQSVGGSAYVEGLKGTTVEITHFCSPLSAGQTIYVPNDKDMQDIRDGYQLACDKHAKKVQSYLKKYGLKHVNSWSYWRDE